MGLRPINLNCPFCLFQRPLLKNYEIICSIGSGKCVLKASKFIPKIKKTATVLKPLSPHR